MGTDTHLHTEFAQASKTCFFSTELFSPWLESKTSLLLQPPLPPRVSHLNESCRVLAVLPWGSLGRTFVWSEQMAHFTSTGATGLINVMVCWTQTDFPNKGVASSELWINMTKHCLWRWLRLWKRIVCLMQETHRNYASKHSVQISRIPMCK